VTFSLRGYGVETFVASSGSTWAPVTVRWDRPPALRIRITHTIRMRGRQRRLVVLVSVTDTHHRALTGMPVYITAMRPQQPTSRAVMRRTDGFGRASLSLPARRGNLTISVVTQYGFAQRQTQLRGV
jgi:hypothetical protein